MKEIAIPYKGNGAVMPDIMAGRVSMFFDAFVSSAEFLRSGKMRALAIASPSRIAPLPDVPTFKELGKDFEYSVWLGLLARKDTPPDVVNKLSATLHDALEELGPRLRNEGGDPTFVTPSGIYCPDNEAVRRDGGTRGSAELAERVGPWSTRISSAHCS